MTIFNVMLAKGKGGLEAMAFLYADVVANMGHKSVMLCHKASSYSSSEKVEKYASFTTARFNFVNYYRLYRLLKEYNPEVVMCHGRRAILNCLLVSRFLKNRPKIVGVAHSSRLKDFDKLDSIIAVSRSVRECLTKEVGAKSKILSCYNAINVPEIIPSALEGEEIAVGYMGRFHEVKGVDILLKAALLLKRRGRIFKILLAGDGPQRDELMRLSTQQELEDVVKWLGWVTDKDKFYSLVNIAVVPSRNETFGLAAVEALAYKRPVVVSDCKALKEIAMNSGCGLVFKREDADGLADCLEKLIDNPELREELAAKGRSVALRDYSIVRFANDLKLCLESIIKA